MWRILLAGLLIAPVLSSPGVVGTQEEPDHDNDIPGLPFHPILEVFWGEWRLGQTFDTGISPSTRIDPAVLAGEHIAIDANGFTLLGRRCEANRVEWVGDTMAPTLEGYQFLEPEYRIRAEAVHIVDVQCLDRDRQFLNDDELFKYFNARFTAYFSRQNMILLSYQPLYGPQFILEPALSDQ